MLRGITVLFLALFLTTGRILAGSEIPVVDMKIVDTENPTDFHKYRKILVSPTTNTPEPFEGFGGFCGWPKICRLQNGDCTLHSGQGFGTLHGRHRLTNTVSLKNTPKIYTINTLG